MRKTQFQLAFLCAFCGYLGYHAIWGKRGIVRYFTLKYKIEKDKHKILALEQDVAATKNRIIDVRNEPFELEKIAREDLLLGHTNELIYLIPSKK